MSQLAGQEGFEPPTSGFGDRRSSRWSYWPVVLLRVLPGLLVHRVLVAEGAVLLIFHPLRMESFILGRDYNCVACIHCTPMRSDLSGIASITFSASIYLAITSAITPAPTVRPPSRMAKRNSFSIAIGVINSTSICVLSPGITISTPSCNFTIPVTSVVRK